MKRTEFENRERFSLDKAIEISKSNNAITHILDNGDDTYSVMGHINCEHCDYCDENNEWWDKKKAEGLSYEQIVQLNETITHTPKPDPYAWQKVRMPENYGLDSHYPEVTLIEVERYWNKVISKTVSLNLFEEELKKNGYVIV